MTVENRARSGLPSTTEQRCVVCDHATTDSRCSHCGAAATAGRYVIEKQIAQTPRGRMYLAQDETGKKVALKELVFSAIPNLQQLESFRRETRLLAELDHPGIPKFVDSFEEGTGVGTRLYLAQEFVEGESLADELARRRFEETEAMLAAEQVLEILVWLQRRSPPIFHRDLKPANLIRRKDGTIALVDFGSARDTAVATLGATLDIGTWGYAPPEQLGGDVDATSDLYALGATLVHLLTRTPPRDALAGSGLARLALSERVREILERLLASLPQNRFRNAEEALRAFRGERPASASSGRTRNDSDTAARAGLALILVVTAVIAAIGMSALLSVPKESGSTSSSATAQDAAAAADRITTVPEELVERVASDPEAVRNGIPFGRAVLGAGASAPEIRELVRSELEINEAISAGRSLFAAERSFRDVNGEWLTFERPEADTWKRLGIEPLHPLRRYSALVVDGKLVVEITQNGDRDAFRDRIQLRENAASNDGYDVVLYAMDTANFDYVTMTLTPQPGTSAAVIRLAEADARALQAAPLLEAIARAQKIYELGHGSFLPFGKLTPELATTLGVSLPSPLHHDYAVSVEDGKLVVRASGNVDGDPALDKWELREDGMPNHVSWDWQFVDED